MTRSPTERTLQASVDDHRIASLAALAIALGMVDAAIPSPLPGVKPGLANIMTLFALHTQGWRAAVWVTLLRVVGAGLLLGSLFTPGFWLSLGGALASLLLLGICRALPDRHFSLVSHSLLAAQAHLLGQLLLVRLFLIPYDNILVLFPPLALAALLGGLANGLIASHLVQAHDKD